jgi:hypothetical protein
MSDSDSTNSDAVAPQEGGPAAPPPRKGMPPWAWALIGLAAGALLIGGAWLVYEAGRSAGQQSTVASQETTLTEVAEVVTETAEPTEPPPADTGPPPGQSPEPDNPAPTPDPGGNTPANTPGQYIIQKQGLNNNFQLVTPVAPTQVVLSWAASGDWTSPGAVLKKGYAIGKTKITQGDNKNIWVKLIRIKPDYKEYLLYAEIIALTGVKDTTDLIPIEAGTYVIKVEAGGQTFVEVLN